MTTISCIRTLSRGGATAALCAFLVGAASVPHGSSRQDDTSREQASLSEEQSLLRRQLRRLRDTMSTQAARLESEGRVNAAKLLRAALEHLDRRSTETLTRTVDELMDTTREDIRAGRTNNALESQEQIIKSLGTLLDILMDRRGLETLQQELEQLREIRAALSELADAEAVLQQDTVKLQQDSTNSAQQELMRELSDVLAEQRELLASTEQQSRDSGLINLEELKARLDELVAEHQITDEVFQAWNPGDVSELRALRDPLQRARTADAERQRFEDAARTLERAASAPANGREDERVEALEDLQRAAERAERDARASGNDAAERAAQTLKNAARAMQESADPESRAAAAESARDQARQLAEAARASERQTSAALQDAAEAARELAREETAAGGTGKRVLENLERALQRAQEGEVAGEELKEAIEALDQGVDEQSGVAEALENAERKAASDTGQLARDLASTAERTDTEDAGRAAQALEQAQEAMQRASEAARTQDGPQGSRASSQASQALGEAQAALSEAMQQAAQGTPESRQASEQRQEGQEALGERVQQAQEQVPQGAMDEEAERSVQEALERAQQSMQRAAQSMSRGEQSAQTKSDQREAIDALQDAQQAAQEGVEPQTDEQQERSRELAERQREIEKRLLELAERNEERESPLPQPNLQQAAQSSQRASESLDSGDLGQAQREEEETERRVREALDELGEEEEQYQRLRQEELLFKIAEEVDAMIDMVREQMRATKEIHAQRARNARISRSARVRLRNVSREFNGIAQRAGTVRSAIEEEGVLVFTEVIRNVESDLTRVARDMGESGNYQSGERVQALQEDVETNLVWLQEALKHEIDRRQEEGQEQPGGEGPDQEEPLVPDVAELKLLRRMEFEVLAKLDQKLQLHPELGEPEVQPDPLLLEDLSRLAYQHNRIVELFVQFRKKLGIPPPGGGGQINMEDGQ